MNQDPRIGQQGSAMVEWPNGCKTVIRGTVILIDKDAGEVYLEPPFVRMVGNLDTLEMEGD